MGSADVCLGTAGLATCAMTWATPMPRLGEAKGPPAGYMKSLGRLDPPCRQYFAHPWSNPFLNLVILFAFTTSCDNEFPKFIMHCLKNSSSCLF